jgi:alkylation response protein AidB-like acyl-CoA dehydrogenase
VTTGLTPEQERFAAEVRRLLAGPEVTAELGNLRRAPAGAEPDPRPLYRLLGARRLLAVHWPARYGGQDRTPLEAGLVAEATIHAGVPDTLHTLSVQIVGNLLLAAGSAEQRERHLPALAAGERFATVLYSEPDAGSDLGALRTEAGRAADGSFRLHGRKVFSVKTHLADTGLCLARTSGADGGPYRDLTLFLVPLDAAGVDVGALGSMADERFADVLLDGVRVGEDAVVGPVGGAWPLLADALALERTGVDYQAKARRWLEAAVRRAAAAAPLDGGTLEAVGRLGARVEASRLLAWATLDQLAGGRADPATAAAGKWYASETARRVAWWALETLGLEACLRAEDPDAALDGLLDAAYREAPGLTISAGTSEMMLQTVAGSLLAAEDRGGP